MASKPTSGSSSSPHTAASTTAAADDVMMGDLTLRLDAKWERFTANVAVQLLESTRDVVRSIRIVAYAASACLLLYGASCVLRAVLSSPTDDDDDGTKKCNGGKDERETKETDQ